MARQPRTGISFPLQGEKLSTQASFVAELELLGYSDVWTSEAQDLDGFVPLALASQWAPTLRLGVAILPVQTRGPAVLAMSAAALAEAAPGRCVIGLGSSSEYIVSYQNARPFVKPFQQTRDTVRFLRAALRAPMPTESYETFLRARLQAAPARRGAAADPRGGAARGHARDGGPRGRRRDPELRHARRRGEVGRDRAQVRRRQGDRRAHLREPHDRRGGGAQGGALVARRRTSRCPTYRQHQEWLGNERYYTAMWKCWGEGDIKGARAALSDEACDRLYIHGTPDECRARIQEYFDAGLDTAIIGLVEEALDPREAVSLLAPD